LKKAHKVWRKLFNKFYIGQIVIFGDSDMKWRVDQIDSEYIYLKRGDGWSWHIPNRPSHPLYKGLKEASDEEN